MRGCLSLDELDGKSFFPSLGVTKKCRESQAYITCIVISAVVI